MEYYECIAYRKGWCNWNLAEQGLEHAHAKLDRYPKAEDWRSAQFLDTRSVYGKNWSE